MKPFVPIDFFFKEILGCLSKNQIFVLVGETGSGKTTKFPHFLFLSGLQKNKTICCSQPRRIAAISIAKKVSFDMKIKLGSEIGYSIRFEDCTSKKTRLKFITDGLLLKEIINNPFLNNYSILILDEIHERTLNTELILVLCKNLIQVRKDIKIIMMSATLNVEKYSKFFQNCPIFCIPGKCFKVNIYYQKKFNNEYIFSCYESIIKILKNFFTGNILVFLPGKKDIDTLGNLLFFFRKTNQKNVNFRIIPIFRILPFRFQLHASKKPFLDRDIFLSTNIAETSLTIPGITFVIDSGFVKKKIFNPFSSSENLTIFPISRNNALQRSGRAGRVCNGKCFRIYTKWSFLKEMNNSFAPEIQRVDFSQIILFLKGLGFNNLISFDWLDFPSKISFSQGFETLYCLGALSKNGKLTIIGRKMVEFPLKPMLARTLFFSIKYNCCEEFLSIASMILSSFPSENFSIIKKNFSKKKSFRGDHLFLMYLFLLWKTKKYSKFWLEKFHVDSKWVVNFLNIKNQLLKIVKKLINNIPSTIGTEEGITKSFLSGYFLNISKFKEKNIYKIVFRENLILTQIHPYSIINIANFFPFFIFFSDLINISRPLIKIISGIKKKWLLDFLNNF